VAARATGAEGVACYADYLRRLAPTTWHDWSPYVERVDAGEKGVLFNDHARCMAMTSGTTGYLNKPVPYNEAMIAAFREYQFLVAGSMAHVCPGVNPAFDYRLGYASAQVRGGLNAKGLPRTYTSTVLTASASPFTPRRFLPSPEVLAISDWDAKLAAICEAARGRDVRIVTGIPLYMKAIFESLVARLGVTALNVLWPNLSAFFYSGSNIEPYRDRLDALAGRRLTYLAGYVATEGPLGFPVDDSGLMAFNLDHFLFSFLPVEGNAEVPWGIDALEPGGEYEVLLGMPNGFLQYRTGDVIRVESVTPLVAFRFVGRREATINLGNEKVSQPQLDSVFRRVRELACVTATHYFVHPSEGGPHTGDKHARPRYVWTVACAEAWLDGEARSCVARRLESLLDAELMRESRNYEDSRLRDGLIGPPEIRLLPLEACDMLFARGRDRGQFKLKSVLRSETEWRRLLTSDAKDNDPWPLRPHAGNVTTERAPL
jgi:hypothetical protein